MMMMIVDHDNADGNHVSHIMLFLLAPSYNILSSVITNSDIIVEGTEKIKEFIIIFLPQLISQAVFLHSYLCRTIKGPFFLPPYAFFWRYKIFFWSTLREERDDFTLDIILSSIQVENSFPLVSWESGLSVLRKKAPNV